MSVTRLTNQEFYTTYKSDEDITYEVIYIYDYTIDSGMLDYFNGHTPRSLEIEITNVYWVPNKENVTKNPIKEIKNYLSKSWFYKQICDLIEDAHVGQ